MPCGDVVDRVTQNPAARVASLPSSILWHLLHHHSKRMQVSQQPVQTTGWSSRVGIWGFRHGSEDVLFAHLSIDLALGVAPERACRSLHAGWSALGLSAPQIRESLAVEMTCAAVQKGVTDPRHVDDFCTTFSRLSSPGWSRGACAFSQPQSPAGALP